MAKNNRLKKVPSGTRIDLSRKGWFWGAVKWEMGGNHIIKEMMFNLKLWIELWAIGFWRIRFSKSSKNYKAQIFGNFSRMVKFCPYRKLLFKLIFRCLFFQRWYDFLKLVIFQPACFQPWVEHFWWKEPLRASPQLQQLIIQNILRSWIFRLNHTEMILRAIFAKNCYCYEMFLAEIPCFILFMFRKFLKRIKNECFLGWMSHWMYFGSFIIMEWLV